MAADPFSAGVGDDIGAESEGALDVPAHAESVVDDERDTLVVGDLGNCWDVGNVVLGVGNGFDVHGSGILVDGCGNLGWVIADNEFDLDVEFLHVDTELVVGSAIEP